MNFKCRDRQILILAHVATGKCRDEMVTLFLEQFKLKQKPHCAHSQKGTGCHWKQNIEVETGLDM